MREEEPIRLLAIHYFFPPTQVVTSIRLQYFLQNLSKKGVQLYGLVSSNNLLFPQDSTLVSPIENVSLVPTNDQRTRLAGKQKSAAFLSSNKRKKILYRLFKRFYQSFPFVFFTGDGGYSYIMNAVRLANREVEENKITHIFTSYRPWSDHIIAARLKKKHPHLIWIADFRDLPIDPKRKDVWWPSLQYFFQQKILSKANIVTTVSEGLARHLQKCHPNVFVVRNGLTELPTLRPHPPSSKQFTISYTGSIYQDLQTPGPLFEILRDLIDEGIIKEKHLMLQYAGKDGELWQEWIDYHKLTKCSVRYGMVSLRSAQSIQRESQLNLLLSWSDYDYTGIITAKLASYLMTGRPIITILNGPPDPELSDIIENTKGGFVFSNTREEQLQDLRQFVTTVYQGWVKTGTFPWQADRDKLIEYTWEKQIHSFYSYLNKNSIEHPQRPTYN